MSASMQQVGFGQQLERSRSKQKRSRSNAEVDVVHQRERSPSKRKRSISPLTQGVGELASDIDVHVSPLSGNPFCINCCDTDHLGKVATEVARHLGLPSARNVSLLWREQVLWQAGQQELTAAAAEDANEIVQWMSLLEDSQDEVAELTSLPALQGLLERMESQAGRVVS